MKRSFFLAGGFALTLFFAACGDDGSSSNNVDQETDGSSSSVEDSTEVSSSSAAEYKDPTWPEGARAATLSDLKKYYLVKIKDETFHLGTGLKEGLFSLWAIDEVESGVKMALLLVTSDFKDGIIKMGSSNSDVMIVDEKLASNKILKDISKADKPMEISFIVDKDVLKYRVDKGEFVEAEVEQLKVNQSLVTDAGNLDKKRLDCKVSGNDTVQVYSFYNGRYVLEKVVGKDTVSWSAGYVDTFRGYTTFVTKFTSATSFAVMLKKITASMDSIYGESKCTKSSFNYSGVDAASLKGEWVAFDEKANMDWSLNLKASMGYELEADDKKSEWKDGTWDVYGDVLLLKVEKLLNASERKCPSSIKGNVSGASEKGFTYNHSDKCTPALPKTWKVPVFEE